MQSVLEINGKDLCAIKDAARVTSYSRDYITRLAREGKITASHIGRQWFVDIDSLQAYAEASALEHQIRRQQLSEERKRERQLREIVEAKHTLQIATARKFEFQAVFVSFFVLFVGLSTGTFTYQLMTTMSYQLPQFVPALTVAPASSQPALVSESVELRRSVAPATAATTPADSATHSVKPLGDIEAGILLLPGATTTATELFSDEVRVEALSDGTSVVRRLDARGQPVGKPIPYVEVSINASTP